MTLMMLALGRTAPAAEAPWAPKLYGFCMEMPAVKQPSIPKQAQMLRELGFDGAGYSLWLDGNLE
jgi:hypothetical protein